MKAIGEAYGRSAAQIKLDLKKEGDLGKVAQVRPASRLHEARHRRGLNNARCLSFIAPQISRTKQKTMFKPKPLTVPGVFAKLTDIAKISGSSVRYDFSR